MNFLFFIFFFFFNDTATTEIYTLSLHDALPISGRPDLGRVRPGSSAPVRCPDRSRAGRGVRDRDVRAGGGVRSPGMTSARSASVFNYRAPSNERSLDSVRGLHSG